MMASTRLEQMRAKLEEIADDWGMGMEVDQTPSDAQKRRRQEEQQEEERLRQLAQHRQYVESNAAFIDRIVGVDEAMVTKLAALETELRELHTQLGETKARLLELESGTEANLEETDLNDLLATALKRNKAESAEVRALHLVQGELQRRLVNKEAALTEQRAAYLKEQRLRLHTYADQLVAACREPLFALNEKFIELRRVEDAVRGMGGVRHAFSTPRLIGGVGHMVDRWDQEMKEIQMLSEAH